MTAISGGRRRALGSRMVVVGVHGGETTKVSEEQREFEVNKRDEAYIYTVVC